MARPPQARPKPYGALAGVALVALVALVLIAALVVTWLQTGGDMNAPIDLGGRWGSGTLRSAVFGLGAAIAVMVIADVFLVRSLIRRRKR